MFGKNTPQNIAENTTIIAPPNSLILTMAETAHLLMVTKKSVFANLKKEAKSANKKSKQ